MHLTTADGGHIFLFLILSSMFYYTEWIVYPVTWTVNISKMHTFIRTVDLLVHFGCIVHIGLFHGTLYDFCICPPHLQRMIHSTGYKFCSIYIEILKNKCLFQCAIPENLRKDSKCFSLYVVLNSAAYKCVLVFFECLEQQKVADPRTSITA